VPTARATPPWAPNLTDKIWLHGWGEEAIVIDMINNGKTNVMPAFRPAADARADPCAGGLRVEPVATRPAAK
jgi:hypothetical protein